MLDDQILVIVQFQILLDQHGHYHQRMGEYTRNINAPLLRGKVNIPPISIGNSVEGRVHFFKTNPTLLLLIWSFAWYKPLRSTLTKCSLTKRLKK